MYHRKRYSSPGRPKRSKSPVPLHTIIELDYLQKLQKIKGGLSLGKGIELIIDAVDGNLIEKLTDLTTQLQMANQTIDNLQQENLGLKEEVPQIDVVRDKQWEALKQSYITKYLKSGIKGIDWDQIKEDFGLKNRADAIRWFSPKINEMQSIADEKGISITDSRIEYAHEKLREVLKINYYRVDHINDSVWKTYSEYTGIPVPDLKKWLVKDYEEQQKLDALEREQKLQLMEKEQPIEFAHKKLLEILVVHDRKMNEIPDDDWETYSNKCGQSVDELKKWMLGVFEKWVEETHVNLRAALKNYYNRFDMIPDSVWKFSSEYCGQSVDELQNWLRQDSLKKGVRL